MDSNLDYRSDNGRGCADDIHEWGEVSHSRFAGTPHRSCKHCPVITLDLSDEEEDEYS